MSLQWLQQVERHIRKVHGDHRADALVALGLPNQKTESWLHAGSREFFAVDRHVLTDTSEIVPSKKCLEDFDRASASPRIFFWNGVYIPELSNVPKGVEVSLEPCLPTEAITPKDDLLTLLPSYMRKEKAHIVISQDLEMPLHIVQYIEGTLPTVYFNEMAYTVAPHVKAELFLETNNSTPAQAHMLCFHTNIHIGEGATCTFSDVPNPDMPTIIANATVTVADKAHFTRNTLSFSPHPRREGQNVEIGSEAKAEMRGIALQNSGVTSFHSRMKHLSPRSESDQAFRSAIFQKGRVAVDMSAEVTSNAGGTLATQESRHLLLQAGARAFSIPRLIINTDDVQCRHGATVGHADKEQIAYMRARGIGAERAKSLLAVGHLTALLEQYPDSIQQTVTQTLRKALLLA